MSGNAVGSHVLIVEGDREQLVYVQGGWEDYRELCVKAHRVSRDRRPFELWLAALDDVRVVRRW